MDNVEIKLTATTHPYGRIELETTGYGGRIHKQVLDTQGKLVRDARKAHDEMMARSRTVPAQFKVHESDVTRMEAELSKLAYVKSDERRHTEFMGIKIVEDEKVLPGHVVICSAHGEVLDVRKLYD